MRKLLAGALASLLIGSTISLTIGSGVAQAHQPLSLLDTDTSASKGPLIVDGTLSFAVRAAFTKAGQKKAFRAQLKEATGSATDLNGNYSIGSLKPGNITLDVSYLGYKTQSISVTVRSSGVTTANFTLTEDAQLLQEAVIVGYGTTQTRDLTGAVTAIPSNYCPRRNSWRRYRCNKYGRPWNRHHARR